MVSVQSSEYVFHLLAKFHVWISPFCQTNRLQDKEGWLWLWGFLCRSYGTFLLFFILKGLTPLAITCRPYGTCIVSAKNIECDFISFGLVSCLYTFLPNKRIAVVGRKSSNKVCRSFATKINNISSLRDLHGFCEEQRLCFFIFWLSFLLVHPSAKQKDCRRQEIF